MHTRAKPRGFNAMHFPCICLGAPCFWMATDARHVVTEMYAIELGAKVLQARTAPPAVVCCDGSSVHAGSAFHNVDLDLHRQENY